VDGSNTIPSENSVVIDGPGRIETSLDAQSACMVLARGDHDAWAGRERGLAGRP
jgi:hypothetical protein